MIRFALLLLALLLLPGCRAEGIDTVMPPRQITHTPEPHVLTNVNVFSPDGKWIVYDVRSAQGSNFDGDRIERVQVDTGEVDVLYRATDEAKCGVVSYDPAHDRVAFILGPTHPTPDFNYGAARRQGVLVDVATRRCSNLDARDLTPPLTAGALRGGTHVHIFDPTGTRVSSTYEDHVLDRLGPTGDHDLNQRTIAISVLGTPVHVAPDNSRNHDGDAFTAVVVATENKPAAGSDAISRAFEESWIGTEGYVRADGTRQRWALAFQGSVTTREGATISEVFVVDLPDDLTKPGKAGPIEGTATRRPAPPAGCAQRRLTFTADRAYPGIQGPRHWLRSSPDGSCIAFLMKDDRGIIQLWTISPNSGTPKQLTSNPFPIASAFTWSPDGRWIAHVMDNSVCVTDTGNGKTCRLTPRAADESAPRDLAAVFSPDGRSIAFIQPTRDGADVSDQVWLASLPDRLR